MFVTLIVLLLLALCGGVAAALGWRTAGLSVAFGALTLIEMIGGVVVLGYFFLD